MRGSPRERSARRAGAATHYVAGELQSVAQSSWLYEPLDSSTTEGHDGPPAVEVVESRRSRSNGGFAGDVNADGLGDVVLAARGEQRVYVVYGKGDGDVVSLSDVADGAGGFAFETSADMPVLSVGGAGDVDGDGAADIIVGAPVFNEDRSYVVFGVPTGP